MTEGKKKLPEDAGQDQAPANKNREYVDAIVAMGKRIMVKKWGPDHTKRFYEENPDIYKYIVEGTAESINDAFSEIKQPRHEHTLAVMRKIAGRMLEVAIARALAAHLLNAIQGKRETLKDFYSEINISWPQLLEIEVEKHPDAPGYMDGGSKQQLDVFLDAIGPEDVTAVYNKTFDTIISQILRDTAKAARAEKEKTARALIVENSVLSSEYFPMHHGIITDILALYDSKGAKYEGRDAVIRTPTAYIRVRGAKTRKGNLGINTHKLLCVAVSEFTKHNHFSRSKKDRVFNRGITIPFEEYARQLGYKIDLQPTDSEEAAQKEKKRAGNQKKLARRRINEDLKTLGAIYMEYKSGTTAKSKKGEDDTIRVNLIEAEGIVNGSIQIAFTQTAATILSRCPLMQYPRVLMRISANSPNAYRIGLKMTMQYFLYTNITKGTRDRLAVTTILEQTDLPTIEVLQVTGETRHWEDRIKEPIERALDTLTGTVISNWEYIKAKGVKLTDQEAASITEYEVFSSLYVKFKVIGEPENMEEKLKAHEQKKIEALENQPKKTRAGSKKS